MRVILAISVMHKLTHRQSGNRYTYICKRQQKHSHTHAHIHIEKRRSSQILVQVTTYPVYYLGCVRVLVQFAQMYVYVCPCDGLDSLGFNIRYRGDCSSLACSTQRPTKLPSSIRLRTTCPRTFWKKATAQNRKIENFPYVITNLENKSH